MDAVGPWRCGCFGTQHWPTSIDMEEQVIWNKRGDNRKEETRTRLHTAREVMTYESEQKGFGQVPDVSAAARWTKRPSSWVDAAGSEVLFFHGGLLVHSRCRL